MGGPPCDLEGLPCDPQGDRLAGEALKTCLRGQTFFSLGLRFLYLFIPLVRGCVMASYLWWWDFRCEGGGVWQHAREPPALGPGSKWCPHTASRARHPKPQHQHPERCSNPHLPTCLTSMHSTPVPVHHTCCARAGVQVMWTMGGTWLLLGTVVEVTFLFILDQV